MLSLLKRFKWRKLMDRKREYVTIKDIAKISGVSVATVSLALAGDKRVNKHTREKVESVARDLNYVPNEIGRSLQAKKVDTIALIFPNTPHNAFSHPYFVDLLAGIMDIVTKEGFHLLISTTTNETDEKLSYSKLLKNRRADGFILWPSPIKDENIFEIIKSGIPTVYLNKSIHEDIVTVERDDMGGAYRATEHLISLGRKKIVHISGPKDYEVTKERQNGYQKAIEESTLLYDTSLVIEGDFFRQGGVNAVKTLIKNNVEFDAIFAANDLMAIGAIDALQSAGLNVPKDVAVVGCDNIDLATMTNPPLTSLYQEMKKIGEIAAQRIIEILQNKKINQVKTVVPAKLIIRDSCGMKNIKGYEKK